MTEGGWRATCSAQRTERKNRNLVLNSSKYRVLRREKEPERRSGLQKMNRNGVPVRSGPIRSLILGVILLSYELNDNFVQKQMSKRKKVYCVFTVFYYRAMHFSAKRGCRLSVCLSVCL